MLLVVDLSQSATRLPPADRSIISTGTSLPWLMLLVCILTLPIIGDSRKTEGLFIHIPILCVFTVSLLVALDISINSIVFYSNLKAFYYVFYIVVQNNLFWRFHWVHRLRFPYKISFKDGIQQICIYVL